MQCSSEADRRRERNPADQARSGLVFHFDRSGGVRGGVGSGHALVVQGSRMYPSNESRAYSHASRCPFRCESSYPETWFQFHLRATCIAAKQRVAGVEDWVQQVFKLQLTTNLPQVVEQVTCLLLPGYTNDTVSPSHELATLWAMCVLSESGGCALLCIRSLVRSTIVCKFLGSSCYFKENC